jgi:hypothetical protein
MLRQGKFGCILNCKCFSMLVSQFEQSTDLSAPSIDNTMYLMESNYQNKPDSVSFIKYGKFNS